MTKKNSKLIISLLLKLAILGFLLFNMYSILNPMMSNDSYSIKDGKVENVEITKITDDLIGNIYKIDADVIDNNNISYNLISSNQDRHTAEAFKNSLNKNAKIGIYNNKIDYVNINYEEKTLKENEYIIDSDKMINIRLNEFIKLLGYLLLCVLIMSII
jgi:hypothetical protein